MKNIFFLIKQEILLTKQININVQEFLILYFYFVPIFFQKTLIFFYNSFKNIQQSLAMQSMRKVMIDAIFTQFCII